MVSSSDVRVVRVAVVTRVGTMTKHRLCIWRGIVKSLPCNVRLDVEVPVIDPALVSMRSVSYNVEQLSQYGELVMPCNVCLGNRVTTTILLQNLYLVVRGNKAWLTGNVEIICDGSMGHSADVEVVLCINVEV